MDIGFIDLWITVHYGIVYIRVHTYRDLQTKCILYNMYSIEIIRYNLC
jgi:hypothetical protein